jgi:hypothetical protein
MTSQVPATSHDPGPAEQPYERTGGPVDEWFGLSFANFLVVHRVRLQSMPLQWQRRLVGLLEELRAAYGDAADPDFQVTTVVMKCFYELTPADLAMLGVTVSSPDVDQSGEAVYIDSSGNEMDGRCLVGVPIPDPVLHYRHNYLRPDEDAIAAVRMARQTGAAGGAAVAVPGQRSAEPGTAPR